MTVVGVGRAEEPRPACLIVNADDYGYSEGVSLGILAAAREGVVTATGILATSPFFDEHVEALLPVERVDAGVHLDLTACRPLTSRLATLLAGSRSGSQPGKLGVVHSILSGRIDLAAVEEEWDAQIRRCREAGVLVRFLNSHEHLHALPSLYRLAWRLARRYGIPHVRRSRAEWFGFPGAGALARNGVLQFLSWMNRGEGLPDAPILLGVSRSGKLDRGYLERRMATLRRGRVYELMCHPGKIMAGEAVPPRLRAYHDWEGELDALLGAERGGLFRHHGIVRIGYRNLDSSGKWRPGTGAALS